MEVRQAIAIAKEYVSQAFDDERPQNIGLEEVEFDDADGEWLVTVGLSRPWDRPALGVVRYLSPEAPQPPLRRSFKTVTVRDADGKVLALRHRDLEQ